VSEIKDTAEVIAEKATEKVEDIAEVAKEKVEKLAKGKK